MKRAAVILLAVQIVLLMLLVTAMPAHAAVVAYVVSPDGSRIELHDDKLPCEGQALRAVHVTPSGERTTGCWRLHGQRVRALFLDGDDALIPVGVLSKPAPA